MMRSTGKIAVGLAWLFCVALEPLHASEQGQLPRISSVVVRSEGALGPLPPRPRIYQRWLRRLMPTTAEDLLRSQLPVGPGDVLDYRTFARIEQRLGRLPYLAKATAVATQADDASGRWEVLVRTQDRFPLTVESNWPEGALLSVVHRHAWGLGHVVRNQLFLKKRWGYGLEYAWPKAGAWYRAGGQWYLQVGKDYRFQQQQLAVGQTFAAREGAEGGSRYWAWACSGSKRRFSKRPWVADQIRRSYHNHDLLLGKLGFVDDATTKVDALYGLRAAEVVPKGGSVECVVGYRRGECHKQPYLAFQAKKNTTAFGFCHVSCAAGTFFDAQRVPEEGVLCLALDYASPVLERIHRQFVSLDCVVGYRMPAERALGLHRGDPAELTRPDAGAPWAFHEPIQARFKARVDRFLHPPIACRSVRFACFGFGALVALCDRRFVLLNSTLVEAFGLGVRVGHLTRPWPALNLRLGYSPFLGKMVPEIAVALCPATNAFDWKPALVDHA